MTDRITDYSISTETVREHLVNALTILDYTMADHAMHPALLTDLGAVAKRLTTAIALLDQTPA